MCTIYYKIIYIMTFDVYIICTYKYISSINNIKLHIRLLYLYKAKLFNIF